MNGEPVASSFFTHIYFVNSPSFPDERSRAERVAAKLAVFDRHMNPTIEWQGRWAYNEEARTTRDPRPQRQIDIDPDGQPAALDVTIRNPGAYAVFGYNDESLRCDRGFDDRKALNPGSYVLRVTLQGVRVPLTDYWFDLDIDGPAVPVKIQRQAAPAASTKES